MKFKNIILIGPLGVGKTTIGRQLAKRAHLIFYDTDQEIEKQTGVSVTTIFDIEGEAGFRKREKEMIAQLTQLENIVLSTGGGSILHPENREAFSKSGIVVYLHSSIETQFARTSQRKGVRPLLMTQNPFQTIVELNQIRNPLYESIANFSYNTDIDSPKHIADQIFDVIFDPHHSK